MELDEIFFKRLTKLREDLIFYIETIYLEEFNINDKNRLNEVLEELDKDGKMLDLILMEISIEGELDIEAIDRLKLNKNISRVIFKQFCEEVVSNTDFKDLNINLKAKEEADLKKIKVLAKDYAIDNARELFMFEKMSLNHISFVLENNKLKKNYPDIKIIK